MLFAALSVDHGPQFAQFPCGEPETDWGLEIKEMVRDRLEPSLAAGEVRGVGCWDDAGNLCGLIAYKPDRDPAVWHVPLLITRPANRRQHIAITLKRLVLCFAHEAGALTVASTVHRENGGMRWLNDQLEADSEPYPPFPKDYLIYTIPLGGVPVE